MDDLEGQLKPEVTNEELQLMITNLEANLAVLRTFISARFPDFNDPTKY